MNDLLFPEALKFVNQHFRSFFEASPGQSGCANARHL